MAFSSLEVKAKQKEEKVTIEADLENISYLCGPTFQDISSEVFGRGNLTCLGYIEATYYGTHNEDMHLLCVFR